MSGRSSLWFILALFLPGVVSVSGAQKRPVVGKPSPVFTLNDVDGTTRTLKDWRGKTLVVLFFCPCEYCKPVSKLWGEAQTSGALIPASPSDTTKGEELKAPETPATLVFFAGEEDATREFAAVAGFDKEHTILFPDYKLRTARLYDAIPCPRVFVVDSTGILRYTNNEAGAKPDTIPAPTIVSRAITAVQRVVSGLPVPETKPAKQPKPSAKPKGQRRAKR